MSNSMAIDQTVAEIWQFFDFSKFSPSTILDLLCACLNHVVVVIVVQNLVGIDAVVSIECNF